MIAGGWEFSRNESPAPGIPSEPYALKTLAVERLFITRWQRGAATGIEVGAVGDAPLRCRFRRCIIPDEVKLIFRPSRPGLTQFLGDLESRVMKELWRKPGARAREIRSTLSQEKPVALTTVLTVLERLSSKGLVERTKDAGSFLFFPKVSREDFERQVVRSILEGLMQNRSQPTLSTFVELVSHDEELLRELEELVRRKRR